MRTGQDYIENASGSAIAGFNRKIFGHDYNDAFRHPHERANRDMQGGWMLAEELIEKGEIYFVHNFHQSHENCSGLAFLYGGSFVCNTCQKNNLEKPWWVIKVYKDGNAWCCVGEDFINLQESDNVAFAETRKEAIENYGNLFKTAKGVSE